jgi:hypothetical protein
MGMVRLFTLKDNTKSFVDVPAESVAEAQVELELSGAVVYHAKALQKPSKRSKARLSKRLY